MYSFQSRVRYSEVDSNERLSLDSILNYFQDCSTFHSEDLGVGIEYLKSIGCGWVLSYWQINIDRYPCLCENIRVSTMPYDLKGFLGFRNFIMEDEKENRVAYANSLWSFLDLKTGHPTKIPEKVYQSYTLEQKLAMNYEPRKIKIPENGDKQEVFTIKKNQIDSNHHVNNGQYIQMAFDYLTPDIKIHQMRAEYKKAAFLDDKVLPIINREMDRVVVSLCDKEEQPYAIVEFS